MKKQNDETGENGDGDEVVGGAHPPRLFSVAKSRNRKPGRLRKWVFLAGLVLLVAAASWMIWRGRESVPEGQVIATVNGEEITATDLANEARAIGSPLNTEAARRAVLESIIDRQVLVQAAIDQRLDRSPQFLAEQRRSEQVMLARLALEHLTQGIRQPSPEEMQRFVDNNAGFFQARQKLTLDQIRFTPATALSNRELAPLDSLEEAERLLQARGVQFERGSMTLDSASLQPQAAGQVLRMPTGELFFVAENGMGVLSRILAREPAPTSESERLTIAHHLLTQRAAADGLRRQVNIRRGQSRIRYQEGYAPAGSAVAGGGGEGRAQP